jgi:GNAT superfamily N-acetyltransferase
MNASFKVRRIGWQERGLHDAVFHCIDRVFGSGDVFRTWAARGGWGPWYTAYAIFDGDAIIANACVSAMQLVVGGARRRGLQLGAVGVVRERRGAGLMRPIMTAIFEDARAAAEEPLVFLFANDDVLDFYPRFGFTRIREAVFRVETRVVPARRDCRRLDIDHARDRALLADVCRRAEPVSMHFAAVDYYGILLWHLGHDAALQCFHAPAEDAVIAVQRNGATLRVADVLTPRLFALEALLPGVIEHGVDAIEFGFSPDRWWPHARATGEYTYSPLFVRAPRAPAAQPFKYPVLAQT